MPESAFIRAVERLLRQGERVVRGPGDDAAVVRAGAFAVTSIDTVAEGVHFDLETHAPADIGHKALAAALSDLAAMGAEPGEAYVSLALPPDFGEAPALDLVAAMEALAETTATTIAGGDVVAARTLVVTVAVTGWAASPDDLVPRDGARPGDAVGVTGVLGGSGAGLMLLRGEAALDGDAAAALLARHRRPMPLLAAGRALAEAGASSMIDLSDGIATDARHLAERSSARLVLRLADLPLDTGVAEVAASAGRDPAELAATCGEDYELLFTAPATARARVEAAAASTRTRVTWLGAVEPGAGIELVDALGTRRDLAGYEHP